MNEKDLRRTLGNEKVDELKDMIKKAKAAGKSPDELKEVVRTFVERQIDHFKHVNSHIQIFVPPDR